jgi:small GTP-binding protein
MTQPKAPAFKFIIIGSSGVGKTAILKRLVDDVFASDCQTTIGVEFLTANILVEQNPVKLQIWDTAGQERFRSIAKAYFRSAMGVMLVFDLTDRKSFEDLVQWLSEVHSLCDPHAVVTLIGNKPDLAHRRAVTVVEAEGFADLHQLTYIETSACGGVNVQEAFARTAATVYRKSLSGKLKGDSVDKIREISKESNRCC